MREEWCEEAKKSESQREITHNKYLLLIHLPCHLYIPIQAVLNPNPIIAAGVHISSNRLSAFFPGTLSGNDVSSVTKELSSDTWITMQLLIFPPVRMCDLRIQDLRFEQPT